MNITSTAGASPASASETTRPAGSGSVKSGAGVPSGSMVDGTAMACSYHLGDEKRLAIFVTSGDWIDLVGASDVAVGATLGVEVPTPDGEFDLVVWRCFDGDVRVMEARCPHQWSHLAA